MNRLFLLVFCGALPVVAAPVFREDFKEVPAHIPAVAADLSSPFLGFKIFGPGKDKVKLSFHPEVKNDPHYLWNGECAGPVLLSFPFQHGLNLSAKDSVVRLQCKNVGKSSLHLALKVNGEWVVANEGLSGDQEWTEHEVRLEDVAWMRLNVDEVKIGGAVRLGLLKDVEAIGFAAPVNPNRNRDCIRLNWFEVESSSAKAEVRGRKAVSLPAGGFIEPQIPFLRTALVIEEAGKVNRVRRGVLLPLGENKWGCFDPDLLRWAAIWETQSGEVPITMASMAAGSYPNEKAKAKLAPRLKGKVLLSTAEQAGANLVGSPKGDPRPGRLFGKDEPVGPVRPEFGRWSGVSMAGKQAVLHYRVGDVEVSEVMTAQGGDGMERLIRVSGGSSEITLMLEPFKGGDPALQVGFEGEGVSWNEFEGRSSLRIQPRGEPRVIRVLWSKQSVEDLPKAIFPEGAVAEAVFPETLTAAKATVSEGKGGAPLRVRNFSYPLDEKNGRVIRPTDVAFLSDGTGLLCSFDGDVWRIDGLAGSEQKWTRVATGLFEPMGIEVDERDRVFVLGRDQVTELIDANGDGHIDVFRNASDAFHQTMHTRDYATSLVVEPTGDFLVAKGGLFSPGKGPERELSEHRGSLLRLSSDGTRAQVLADGLRMPYVGRREDGAVFASDQQGEFVPSTPLLQVLEPQPFFGYEPTRFRKKASTTQPLLWYPHQVNRSAAGFTTLPAKGFPDIGAAFTQVSWNGRLFPVLTPEQGMPFSWQLPVQFDFPTLNGATHPQTGELFVVGLGISGYKPTTPKLSGLAAISQVGPMVAPAGLAVEKGRVTVRFAKPLTAEQSVGISSLRFWNIVRTSGYGSGHFRWDGTPGEHSVAAEAVHLSNDRKCVVIDVPPVFRSHIMTLGMFVTEGASSYPLDLFARPVHLKKATASDLAEVRKREKSGMAVKDGDARNGKEVFVRFACSGCHSLIGENLVGPPLNGIATRKANGLDGYLRESILTPNKVVTEGYLPAMPPFTGVLPPQDLEDLVAYLKSLN